MNINFYRSSLIKYLQPISVSVALLLLPSISSAQSTDLVEIEINRDANELSDLLSGGILPKPEIAAILDTAMVFTSMHNAETTAYCRASDKNGIAAGRVRVRIPAMGVRFFLASDIVEEHGFVGSVTCTATGYVIGTEVMLGVVTTDISTQQDYRAGLSSLLFPVTAMK